MEIKDKTLLDLLRKTPMAQQLESDARKAEQLHAARVRAFEQWQAAESGKAEIPKLRAALEAAEEKYRQAVTEHARAVAEARHAYNKLTGEIERTQSRAEIVLRQTADPAIVDSSNVFWTILQARQHVMSHSTVELEQMRERLRDAKKRGDEDAELARMVEQADAAEAMIPKFDAALDRLRDVQLEVAPDLAKLVSELTGELPTRCVCGERLNLHDAAQAILTAAPRAAAY
jgi:hypothetical protein